MQSLLALQFCQPSANGCKHARHVDIWLAVQGLIMTMPHPSPHLFLPLIDWLCWDQSQTCLLSKTKSHLAFCLLASKLKKRTKVVEVKKNEKWIHDFNFCFVNWKTKNGLMIFNFFSRRIGFRFALFHHHVDYIKLTKNGPFLQFIYEIRKTKIKKRINFQFSFFV